MNCPKLYIIYYLSVSNNCLNNSKPNKTVQKKKRILYLFLNKLSLTDNYAISIPSFLCAQHLQFPHIYKISFHHITVISEIYLKKNNFETLLTFSTLPLFEWETDLVTVYTWSVLLTIFNKHCAAWHDCIQL